jgi:hypothetical protein
VGQAGEGFLQQFSVQLDLHLASNMREHEHHLRITHNIQKVRAGTLLTVLPQGEKTQPPPCPSFFYTVHYLKQKKTVIRPVTKLQKIYFCAWLKNSKSCKFSILRKLHLNIHRVADIWIGFSWICIRNVKNRPQKKKRH